jgi:hypothetical protein
MVQAQENRAILRGRVVGTGGEDAPAGWDGVVLDVEACGDVEGYPNLLASTVGGTVTVTVPRGDLERVLPAPGDLVEVTARRASPRAVMADRGSLARVETPPS